MDGWRPIDQSFPFLCVGEIVDEIVGIALPHWTC